jgi:hypothetical protein
MSTPAIAQFRVKTGLTPDRRSRNRRYVENIDYAAFASRVIKAHGRRVGEGDIEGLVELVALTNQLDTAITAAIAGLRAEGYSWADVALRLGITRQAAQQKWGKTAPLTFAPQQVYADINREEVPW